jgi:hypothetical protein
MNFAIVLGSAAGLVFFSAEWMGHYMCATNQLTTKPTTRGVTAVVTTIMWLTQWTKITLGRLSLYLGILTLIQAVFNNRIKVIYEYV